MATLGQITSEFIIRGETYFQRNIPQLFEDIDDGYDNAQERLAFAYELFQFLIELQGLYQDWSEREIRIMIDYFDSTYNLKALATTIPDPYKSYDNAATITTNTTTLEVPNGNGLLEQKNGVIILYPNETQIDSDYGLG